jgi:predicted Zn-dependent protease
MVHALLTAFLALAQQAPPKAGEPARPVARPNAKKSEVRKDAKPDDSDPDDSRKDDAKKDAKKKDDGGEAPSPPEYTKEQLEARKLATEAVTLFQAAKYEQATAKAKQAAELDPRFDLPLRVMGWCAVSTGDDKRAAELLTDALNLCPSDADLQFLLASCHKRLKEWGAAKDLLGDLVKKNGATVNVLIEMAECTVGEEDWPGALALLGQARKLAPKDRQVVEHFVEIYEKTEEWDKAVAELRPLIQECPKESPLRYRLVQVFLQAEKFKEAAEELEATAKAFPQETAPHETLVQLYDKVVPDEERLEFHRNWLKEHAPTKR